jgi:hypothetical protein
VTHPEKRFHAEFTTDRITKEIRLLSPGLLIGENPSAFARELVLRWGFWSKRWVFDASTWVVMLKRDDLPEKLQAGFGLHRGAVFTSASRTPTLLNTEAQLDDFYMDNLVDAQLRRGEFAVQAPAS